MDTNPINATTPAVTAATAPPPAENSTALNIASDFETFLKMLTAQAKYQDPLEPLDSSEYASQLAQFSSVEQQVQTNDLLEDMLAALGAGGITDFAGWIGMEARSAAPVYFDGAPVTLYPDPAASADKVQLVVYDEEGTEVQRVDIEKGLDPVDWAGQTSNGTTAVDGFYRFEIESFNNDALIRADPVETYSRVTEAQVLGGQTFVILESGARIASSDVTALREPI